MGKFDNLKASVDRAASKAKTIKNQATAKTPRSVKINQNLVKRVKSKNDARARKRAEYLATLPKSRFKRLIYRLHPKNLYRYWFSRDGLKTALKIAGGGVLALTILIAVVFAYYRKDLPKNITDLQACSFGQAIKFYDRTGKTLLWTGSGDIDCRPVALKEISPYLQKAVVAAEDKKFYSHHGFDLGGLINAALSNVKSGGEGRGGSTITQQYVKLSLLTSERSVSRKIKELILSVELDASYKKDEILQAYLNEIGFAYQYNGAEAASQGLFDKPAKDLTLDEAATLAAGIPAPDYYWVQDQSALIERRDYVLDQMVITGAITKKQADEAKKVDTLAKVDHNKSQYKDIKAPHFVLTVLDQLKEKYGKDVTKLGYSVTTTLDMNLQKIAEESVANGFPCQNYQYGVDCQGTFDNAALVSEDVSTGQVVAMVGSRDFNIPDYGQLNMATTPRSPGSSFKPYDYAALMKANQNFGAGSIFYDVNTDFGNYKPKDYDLREPGGISMRYALGGSRNTPAIKAMYIAGINYVHQVAIDLGVYDGVSGCAGAPTCDDILSTAIGDGGQVALDQHVHGYASFARMGKEIPQTYILKITDSKGKTVDGSEWKPSAGKQAIDPQIAYIIDDMLSDKNASYFRNSTAYANRVTNGFEAMNIPAAIKTGTTNNLDNGWMMGFTGKYATGVWVGNHENKSSNGRFDFTNATGPIWGEFMRRAHETLDQKPGAWQKPDGIKTVALDNDLFATLKSKCTAAQAGNICGFPQADIYPSWYTPKKAGTGQKATIDTVSNKLATECTPDLAKKEITSGNIQPEIASSDPEYKLWLAPIVARYGGTAGGAIPTDKDDIHNCGDAKPAVSLNAPASCVGSCDLKATFSSGTHTVKTLNFKVDGQIVQSFDVSDADSPKTYTYVPTDGGSHSITAQVIDDVLYDTTSNAVTMNTTSAGNLTASGSSSNANTKYNMNWNSIAGAACYEIAGDYNGSPFISVTTPGTSYQYSTLPTGTYHFTVKAKTSCSGTQLASSNTLTRAI